MRKNVKNTFKKNSQYPFLHLMAQQMWSAAVLGLRAYQEEWTATSRKGNTRLTRLINAKMEQLYAK